MNDTLPETNDQRPPAIAQQCSSAIIADAARILAILENRLRINGSLSSDYVDNVVEIAKLLWRHN